MKGSQERIEISQSPLASFMKGGPPPLFSPPRRRGCKGRLKKGEWKGDLEGWGGFFERRRPPRRKKRIK